MKKIDFKSAALGLAGGVLAMLLLGAAQSSSGQVGRFQVAGTSNHAVILDTTTGQSWLAYLVQNSGTFDKDFRNAKIPQQ